MVLEEILNILKSVYNTYDGIKIGVAGSYAKGTNKANSDIDVVIDGDSMRVDIGEYIKNLFTTKVDVLWLDLLEKTDNELDTFCIENGLPINNNSVYKSVVREVIWV